MDPVLFMFMVPACILCVFGRKSLPSTLDVCIIPNRGNRVTLHLEVADTLFKKMVGLMHRTWLPADSGMLFHFRFIKRPSFWMKSTPIPLDILFIDEDLKIVDIHPNAEPYSLFPISPKAKCSYVIEVNGGFCERHNIDFGDRIVFEPTQAV